MFRVWTKKAGWEQFLRLLKSIVKSVGLVKNGQRFSIIGVVLGIPIVVIALMIMLELNQEINWTNERLKEVEYSELLIDLLQDVQQHRAYTISYMSSKQHSAINLEDKQLDISR